MPSLTPIAAILVMDIRARTGATYEEAQAAASEVESAAREVSTRTARSLDAAYENIARWLIWCLDNGADLAGAVRAAVLPFKAPTAGDAT